MKISNFKIQISNYTRISLTICLIIFNTATVMASDKWGGVDESVVEKYAEEHGRAARDPLINTDQGDLLLFVFLVAGAIGGFAAGYYWRMLMENRTRIPGNRCRGNS